MTLPFHPELIGYQQQACNFLSDRGIAWRTHYADIDVRHDIYGIQVTGITTEKLAKCIDILLQEFLAEDLPLGKIFTLDYRSTKRFDVIRSRSEPTYEERSELST